MIFNPIFLIWYDECFIATIKFLLLTHVLPILYAICHLSWLNYYDWYIFKKLGRFPYDHEERFKLYFDLREHSVDEDWNREAELAEQLKLEFYHKISIQLEQIVINSYYILINKVWPFIKNFIIKHW